MSVCDPRWDAALDALETEIAQLEFGLATGNLEQIAAAGRWDPPDELSVLPEQLAVRAQQLADRLEAAERQARVIRADLSSELDQLNRKRTAATAYISHDTQDG